MSALSLCAHVRVRLCVHASRCRVCSKQVCVPWSMLHTVTHPDAVEDGEVECWGTARGIPERCVRLERSQRAAHLIRGPAQEQQLVQANLCVACVVVFIWVWVSGCVGG